MINIRCSSLPSVSDCCRMAVANTQREILTEAGFVLNERRTGIYSLIGTAVHKGNETILRRKIVSGALPSYSESLSSAMADFSENLKKSDDVIFDDTTVNQGHAEKQIKTLTAAYYRDVAPKIKFPDGCNPDDHLEVSLRAEIQGFEITGHVDVVSESSILDTKSGKTIRPYHAQLGMYANLLVSTRNWKPKFLITNYLPRVMVDKPYPGTKTAGYDVDFSMNEAWYLANQLIRDIKNFQQCGNPAVFVANPNCSLCSEKYCAAFGTDFCKYYKKGV